MFILFIAYETITNICILFYLFRMYLYFYIFSTSQYGKFVSMLRYVNNYSLVLTLP